MSIVEELELKLEANHSDDETWAVLGDVLTEMGDIRGEIIALDMARLRCYSRGKKSGLTKALRKKVSVHKRYLEGLGLSESVYGGAIYGRGYFYTAIASTINDIMAIARNSCFRFMHTLEIRPWYGQPDKPTNLGQYSLRQLTEMHFLKAVIVSGSVSQEFLSSVFSCPDISMFESITVSRHFYQSDGMAGWIDSSPYLGNVVRLDLGSNHLGLSDVNTIIDSSSLPLVRSLGLSGIHLGDDLTREIAENENSNRLSELDLSKNSIYGNGAVHLAQSRNLSSIVKLDLSGNFIGISGAKALAESRYLSDEVREFYAKLVDRYSRSVQTRKANSSRRCEVD